MTRIALSIIAVGTIWWWCSVVNVSALAPEVNSAVSLVGDRWERRDPFVPLIDLTQEILSRSVTELTASTEPEKPYRYSSEGRRDPFRSVLDVEQDPVLKAGPLTPLEQFEPSQLRLVGMIWNSDGYHGLLEVPGGMAYIARLGTAIGMNGIVSSVSEENLIVRQSVRDVFGEEKTREVELNLYPDFSSHAAR